MGRLSCSGELRQPSQVRRCRGHRAHRDASRCHDAARGALGSHGDRVLRVIGSHAERWAAYRHGALDFGRARQVGRTAFALLHRLHGGARQGPASCCCQRFARCDRGRQRLTARDLASSNIRTQPHPTAMGWSGQAWQDATTHRAVADSVETVVQKVGGQLHPLYRAVWARIDHLPRRVRRTPVVFKASAPAVLVVDDIEAFFCNWRRLDLAPAWRRQTAAWRGCASRIIALLRFTSHFTRIKACSVIFTTLSRHAELRRAVR